jgi:hypothetical protein
MKILFFVDTEYPGFRGSEVDKALAKCGVEYKVFGRGADLVVIKVKDADMERCVRQVLNMAGIYYYEMEGAPRVLRFRSPYGRIIAEAVFV